MNSGAVRRSHVGQSFCEISATNVLIDHVVAQYGNFESIADARCPSRDSDGQLDNNGERDGLECDMILVKYVQRQSRKEKEDFGTDEDEAKTNTEDNAASNEGNADGNESNEGTNREGAGGVILNGAELVGKWAIVLNSELRSNTNLVLREIERSGALGVLWCVTPMHGDEEGTISNASVEFGDDDDEDAEELNIPILLVQPTVPGLYDLTSADDTNNWSLRVYVLRDPIETQRREDREATEAAEMAAAIENAQSNLECVLWGGVALIVQLIAFFTVRLFVPTISEQIKHGEVSAGILLAVISVSVGIINAASMTF